MAKGDSLAGRKRVYSHAQSLAQCQHWLTRNLPQAERVPVSSNAEAARLAAGEPETCAIGPAIAAERYGLAILAQNIEDEAQNLTRFPGPRHRGSDRAAATSPRSSCSRRTARARCMR